MSDSLYRWHHPSRDSNCLTPNQKKCLKTILYLYHWKGTPLFRERFSMSPRRSVNENSLLMVWKECQLFKRPISRFLFSQTLLIKNRQVINVGNALENRIKNISRWSKAGVHICKFTFSSFFWFYWQVKISKEVKQLLTTWPDVRTSDQLQTVSYLYIAESWIESLLFEK